MTAEIFGGCIRLYPRDHPTPGPRWHTDEGHHTVGLNTSVQPKIDAAGFLTFHTLKKNPIITGFASADESLTGRGIRAGFSNGTYLVRVALHKEGIAGPLDLNKPAHYAAAACIYCNLWVGVVHDVPAQAQDAQTEADA